MALILAYKDRGLTRELGILKADGTTITPTVNDKLRVIIGREGKLGTNFADAQFVVTSDAPTSSGSSITKNQNADGNTANGTNTLRLDASDLNFAAGIYTLFFDFFDRADASEYKNVSRQVFDLQNS